MAIIPGTNSGETLTGTNGDDTITALAGIECAVRARRHR